MALAVLLRCARYCGNLAGFTATPKLRAGDGSAAQGLMWGCRRLETLKLYPWREAPCQSHGATLRSKKLHRRAEHAQTRSAEGRRPRPPKTSALPGQALGGAAPSAPVRLTLSTKV